MKRVPLWLFWLLITTNVAQTFTIIWLIDKVLFGQGE